MGGGGNKTRTREKPLHHIYNDGPMRLVCPLKSEVLVGKTSELINYDKDDVIVCHMF